MLASRVGRARFAVASGGDYGWSQSDSWPVGDQLWAPDPGDSGLGSPGKERVGVNEFGGAQQSGKRSSERRIVEAARARSNERGCGVFAPPSGTQERKGVSGLLHVPGKTGVGNPCL